MTTVTQLNTTPEQESTVEALRTVLGDTYALYFKTHSFHWNVEGINFHSLHGLFEEQYTDMWQAADVLAERIRALGAYAPWNFSQMTANSNLDHTAQNMSADKMIQVLYIDHGKTVEDIKSAISTAQETDDEVTIGILTDRLDFHEKTMWMLRSLSK